jgi:hypothetical protein
MSARPGTIHRILWVAIQEWGFFGGYREDFKDRAIRRGHRETEAGYDKKVGEYWRYGTGKNLDGDDTGWAWSATFISYVMRKAGVSNQDFHRSIRHSEYIHFALQNRVNGVVGAEFVGRRPTEYRPKEGDLICNRRGKIKTTFASAIKQDRYESHCDIVVYVRPGEIGVIGGNVGGGDKAGRQTVGLRTRQLTGGGYLAEDSLSAKVPKYFAILENRLPLK